MSTPLMFMHTPKAIRKGCPADRVFLVAPSCTYNEDSRGKRRVMYVAWKCAITPLGFYHPAFKLGQLTFLQAVKKTASSIGRSEPTAEFLADSFYKQVTVENVASLLEKAATGNCPEFNNHPVYLATQREADAKVKANDVFDSLKLHFTGKQRKLKSFLSTLSDAQVSAFVDLF